MTVLPRLEFGSNRLPSLLQTEAAECGIACLAMVASYHGYRIDLATLRARFSVSLKGVTLTQLVRYADGLKFASRPLRLELTELVDLKTPCILHWDLNHFVVLKKADAKGIVIHDPAIGVRHLTYDQVGKQFTGVALELTPTVEFKPATEVRRVSLRGLMGKVDGLWRSLGLVFVMSLALEAFALLSPMFNQWVVDEALASNDRGLLNILVFGFAVMMIVQTAIAMARGWTVMYLSTHLGMQWFANVFTHLLRLPVAWFEKRHLGDVVSRFGSIGTIQHTLTTGFIEAILDGMMAIATLVMIAVYSIKLTVVVLAAVLLYALLRALTYRPLREANEESLVLGAKEQSCFLETIRGVQAIKLFGRELDRRSRWLNFLADSINRGVRTQKFMLWFGIANMVVFGIEKLLVFWLGAHMVMDGSFTIGMLFAFASYQSQFTGRVSSLIDKFIEFRMLSLHAERLADIVLEPAEPEIAHDINTDNLVPRIELVNVSFRYSDGEPWVVRQLNLTIEPGESMVFVGPSGCGKTTLVKLILGILPPTEGEILYGGTPITQMGNRTYRASLAAVMQDDQLLTGSLADNISFFDQKVDRERIEACAKLAAIHDEIVAMPMAYHTLSGDMGTTLSGGQKQRVLLARALYKEPKVLVLDEATSHLDIEGELLVNEAIKDLSITRICVAHRPETIAMAKRVVRLNKGVIESDTRTNPTLALASHARLEDQNINPTPVVKIAFDESLTSIKDQPFSANDSDDLAAFGAAVGDARVVILGQQAYSDGNIMALKSRMVRYLHEQKGFKVLALESGPFDAECVGEAVDAGASYASASSGALFRIFSQASEVQPLLRYLDAQRQLSDGLRLVGFDWQHTGRYSRDELCQRLQQQLSSTAPTLFDDADWDLFCRITVAVIEMNTEIPNTDCIDRYFNRLDAFRQALAKQPESALGLLTSPNYWNYILKVLDRQARHYWKINVGDQAAIRAQSLEEGVLMLAKHFHAEKLVVWAHSNANALRHPGISMLGGALSATLGDKLLVVGFTGSHGSYTDATTGAMVAISEPAVGSFEKQLNGCTDDYNLVDLRRPAIASTLTNVGWRFVNYQDIGLPMAGSFDLMVHAYNVIPTAQEESQDQTA